MLFTFVNKLSLLASSSLTLNKVFFNILFITIFFLEKRQTLLFSATLTKKTEDLVRASIKGTPLYIGVEDLNDEATVEGLKQVFIGFSSIYVTKG